MTIYRLKELRHEYNLSQAKLGKMLGVNQTAIGKYDHGDAEPNIKMLFQLSQIFEVSIDYLLGNSDDFGIVNVKTDKVGSFLNEREKELVNLFRNLNKNQQKAVCEYIKTLTND